MKQLYLNTYGFCADPHQPTWQNVQDYVSLLPQSYLFKYNTNYKGCHNLLHPNILFPRSIPSLLHLGLKFVVHPPRPTQYLPDSIARFKQDVRRISTFRAAPPPKEGSYIPQLHIKSDWEPDPSDVPEVEAAITAFTRAVTSEQRRYNRTKLPNLLPHHWNIMKFLKNHDKYIVVEADKNLGGCILSRDDYITRAFSDHLGNTSVYRRISQWEAYNRQKTLADGLNSLLKEWDDEDDKLISTAEWWYLQQSIDKYREKPTRFRLTIKVHKHPWKTRPIVCCAGTMLNGFSRWIDYWLQQLKPLIPTFIKNSEQLIDDLNNIGQLPPGALLFKADAESMYTNIDTEHAIVVISQWLDDLSTNLLLPPGFPLLPLKQALEIVMRNNIFEFGDTRYLQLTGTAMGTSSACMYATIYFAIHEMATIVPTFGRNLFFVKRYIDDLIGIWVVNDPSITWEDFGTSLNSFGRLRWDIDEPSTSVDYLDLTITINDRRIITRTYRKEMNLYQYLPPHSCHPQSTLKGMIYSLMRTYYKQNTYKRDYVDTVITMFHYLLARGWDRYVLKDLILAADVKLQQLDLQVSLQENLSQAIISPPTIREHLFFHLPYHPHDIPRRRLRQLYNHYCHDALSSILHIDKFTVAYSRHKNLKEHLTQARLHQAPNAEASANILCPSTVIDDRYI